MATEHAPGAGEPALTVDEHPLLELAVRSFERATPLGDAPSPADLVAGLAPPERDAAEAERVRQAVRDLLRAGGYKPTGRGKPASEYLAQAAADGRLASINPIVDACNAASLASGLPISVVDADRLRGDLRVRLGRAGERYVFNTAGQEIDVAGLLVLADAEGPCANAVKDAMRTKTSAATRRVVVLVWGTRALPGLAGRVADHAHALLARHAAG